MRPSAGTAKALLWIPILLLGWAAAGVFARWVTSVVIPGRGPLWHGAIFGIGLGLGTAAIEWAARKGRIRDPFWRREQLRPRERALAEERESILREAQSKLN